MKKRLQGLSAGVLIGVLITNGVVFAKQISETAVLYYNNIKIMLDGREIVPKDANGNSIEPFVIDGITYLPVRGISSALGLNVGWDGNTNTVLLSSEIIGTTAVEQANGYENSAVTQNIEIVKEYTWETDYGNYVALVIKNVSDKTICPRVQISFKNADGTIVGADNGSENAFGAGNEMVFIFRNDENFDSYEYIVSSSEENYYDECVSKLEAKVSTTDKKSILQVTNKGTKPAKFVEYIILFKKGDNVVSYDRGYCVDDDSEIKPGMTEMREASVGYKQSFDSVEVYFTGRSSK